MRDTVRLSRDDGVGGPGIQCLPGIHSRFNICWICRGRAKVPITIEQDPAKFRANDHPLRQRWRAAEARHRLEPKIHREDRGRSPQLLADLAALTPGEGFSLAEQPLDSANKTRNNAGVSTHPLLFDLGRSPTTRDVANLVKAGGVSALPSALRRGDAATYQEVRCKSALNHVKGMPFFKWTLNPYRGCTHGCHYCFARKYQHQLELNSGDEFACGDFVKTLRRGVARELDKPSTKSDRLRHGDGSVSTDQGTYKLSRGVLKAPPLWPIRSIVTKGLMIVRDRDDSRTCRKAPVRIHIACRRLMRAWAALEPGTSHPMQRLRGS